MVEDVLTILLLAAGSSSRMRGRDKLLELVDGKPCLRVMAERALQNTAQVIVTLPPDAQPRSEALSELAVQRCTVADAKAGMSASIKAGMAMLPKPTSAMMILPADMPAITAHDIAQLWAVFQASGGPIVQGAQADGTPGHPVIFAKSLLHEFQNLTGDVGARAVLKRHSADIIRLPFADDRATLDLDTPEDWAAFRKTRP